MKTNIFINFVVVKCN